MPPHPLYVLTSFFRQTFWLPSPPPLHPSTPAPAYLPPDLTNQTYLITGGYSGIGLSVSTLLYAHHATVWIAGRSATRASAAIDSIQTQHPTSRGKLLFLEVDFSDLTTIKPAVASFLHRNGPTQQGNGTLHWLNNNAGVMFVPPGSTGKQGHDLTLVTNIYGPFLFAKLLLPVLRATAADEEARGNTGKVRVSWAGSQATFLSDVEGGVGWVEVQSGERKGKRDLLGAFGDPQASYSTSKAANWFLAREFARRSGGGGDGVLHNSYNPGNLRTSLQRHTASTLGWLVYWIIWNVVCRWGPLYGAYTELYAGFSDDLTLERDQGAWIVPWGRKDEMRPDMQREADKGEGSLGARLWEWCEEVTGEYQ